MNLPNDVLVSIFALAIEPRAPTPFHPFYKFHLEDEFGDGDLEERVDRFSDNDAHLYLASSSPDKECDVFDGEKWQIYLNSRQPVSISGVCRHWRSITVNTPSLWSRWTVVADIEETMGDTH